MGAGRRKLGPIVVDDGGRPCTDEGGRPIFRDRSGNLVLDARGTKPLGEVTATGTDSPPAN